MKNISILFIFLLFSSIGCKTTKPVTVSSPGKPESPVPAVSEPPAQVNFSDQTTWILGYFNPVQLTREPHSSWYIKGYDDYQLKTDAINRLLDINKDGIKIKVVMGTWCPDSRREVPRFMRVMDAWHFPVADITFIGVDNAKLSPVGEYKSLNILRVPTFIIYKNNIEAGRIIENPTTSLEQDIVNILTRNE